MSRKTPQESMADAQEFWDESLVLRAEKRFTGANVHDARCWIQRYKCVCGLYGYSISVCGPNAKWYKDVLNIFANGNTDSISESEKLHSDSIKARTTLERTKQ